MNVVITGGLGFLGWHTACRLRALHGIDALRLGRDDDAQAWQSAVAGADVVLHIAGVNRAETPEDVRDGNLHLAELLADAVRAGGRAIRIVYANSIHADQATMYGEGKAGAARILAEALAGVGGSLADVRLPNLFGEHGRPGYNSFVATFCAAVAAGESPTVTADNEVPLLHAQGAAAALLEVMDGHDNVVLRPAGRPTMVSEVVGLLRGFDEVYRRGEIPALPDRFTVDLFNTYRSYLFPERFPHHPPLHSDPRGDLVETSRAHGGTSQGFVSTTRPGMTRGDHYHLHKIERFFVVRGTAEISLRRLLDDEVVTFRLDGSQPGFVDMPTLWVHNITNVGEDDLVTVFWADQLLDPVNPDQYPERVHLEVS